MQARHVLYFVTALSMVAGCSRVVRDDGPISVEDACLEAVEGSVGPIVEAGVGAARGPASSSIAMTASGLVVVAAEDHGRVLVVELVEQDPFEPSTRVLASIPVAAGPSHVLVEGSWAYVTTRGGGTLEIIDLDAMRVEHSVPVGVEPRGLVRLPGERGLAVALAGEAAVVFVDERRAEVTRRIDLDRAEPWSVAVLGDEYLIVGHGSGGMTALALEGRYTDHLSLLRLTDAHGSPPLWSHRLRPVALYTMTPLGEYVLATHSVADADRARDPAFQGNCAGYYDTCNNGPGAMEPVQTIVGLRPVPGSDAQIPTRPSPALRGRDAADTTAAALLYVAERVLLVSVERGKSIASVRCFAPFSGHRVVGALPLGAGADGVVPTVEGDGAVVWNRFDRTLSLITFPDGYPAVTTSAPILPDPLPTAASRGRRLFHDARRLSTQGNVSCASCHPDGRDDGLSWRFPAGPRNTPTLGDGVLTTAPFHWAGDIADPSALNAMTVSTLMGGLPLDDGELYDLVSYLDTLPAAPAPPVDAALVEQGRALFESPALGCVTCHTGPQRTDNRNHELGRRGASGSFQTPRLRGLARSGPYLHDGSMATLSQLVEEVVRTDLMGRGSHLDDDQARALVAYLESL